MDGVEALVLEDQLCAAFEQSGLAARPGQPVAVEVGWVYDDGTEVVAVGPICPAGGLRCDGAPCGRPPWATAPPAPLR
jgi:hypothetical protein